MKNESAYQYIDSVHRIYSDWLIELIEEQEGSISATIKSFAEQLQAAMDIDTDAALSSLFVSIESPFYVHSSISSALLSDLVARQLKWTKQERISIQCAALTLYLSCIEAKNTQFESMETNQPDLAKQYSKKNKSRLLRSGVEDKIWIGAIEMFDSWNNLTEKHSARTTLLSLVDNYLFYSLPTIDNTTMSVVKLLEQLKKTASNKIQIEMFNALTEATGVLPTGTLLQLDSGGIGIVVKRATAKNKMSIHKLQDKSDAPINAIKRIFPPTSNKPDISYRKLWQMDMPTSPYSASLKNLKASFYKVPIEESKIEKTEEKKSGTNKPEKNKIEIPTEPIKKHTKEPKVIAETTKNERKEPPKSKEPTPQKTKTPPKQIFTPVPTPKRLPKKAPLQPHITTPSQEKQLQKSKNPRPSIIPTTQKPPPIPIIEKAVQQLDKINNNTQQISPEALLKHQPEDYFSDENLDKFGPFNAKVIKIIQQALAKRNARISHFASILQKDKNLVKATLEIANCPLFESKTPIKSLNQAILLVGIERLDKILFSRC
jgi:hypothetical protein